MITVKQIKERVEGYLANGDPFEHFEDWLVTRSWNMHKDSATEAQNFVHELNGPIYAYLDGYITEQQLKESLTKVRSKVP